MSKMYHPSTHQGYDVEQCGLIPNEYYEGLDEEPALDQVMDRFKYDLQKIITKIVDRVNDLGNRVTTLEKSILKMT